MKSVFYSWQSDLDVGLNKGFIRAVISAAINKANGHNEDASDNFTLDSDVINMTGSPDIVDVILNKINACSFFIADITPIALSNNGKYLPNPNVLFETGYAVARKGIKRTLFILNEKYGAVENMPFDLKTKSILTYSLSSDDDNNKKKTVKERLAATISMHLQFSCDLSEAIEDNDRGNTDKVKRDRDIIKIKRFLSNVPLKVIQSHIDRGLEENLVHHGIINVQLNADSVCSFVTFKFYDKKLGVLISDLKNNLDESLSFASDFDYFDGVNYKFKPYSEKNKVKYYDCLRSLRCALTELHDYIHDSYMEIDLEEYNEISYRAYLEEIKKDNLLNDN